MKKKNAWLRWIAWGLILVMGISGIGTTVLTAAEPSAEAREMLEETDGAAESAETFAEGEGTTEDGMMPEGESPLGEEQPSEEAPPSVEPAAPEGSQTPEGEGQAEEGSPADSEGLTDSEVPSEQQDAKTEPPQNAANVTPETYEEKQDYNLDFYIIYEGKKLKLQTNGISGVKTWTQGRTTYHGISVDDLMSVYGEFGFAKGSDGQYPNASKKFVSANRGKNWIEYGTVYEDPDSGKTYVSYNDGADKKNVPVDIYYLPEGKGGFLTLEPAVKRDNSFYSVEVKGEGQDQIHYALYQTTFELSVSNYNPTLPEQTDQIEWTCVGSDNVDVDGTLEAENKTKFVLNKIERSYVIQRADKTAFDIQFYIYVDNEIRQLPSDSLKEVYQWNNNGECYVSVDDLAEIYKEYGMKATDTQYGKYFPYTVRGGKTLAHAGMKTCKGKQYVSYTLTNQSSTVPTDVYYMPKGAEKSEKVPEDVVDGDGTVTSSVADQLKSNKHSFYSMTVLQLDGSQTVTYHKKGDNVTVSVDPGESKADEWLCASEDGKKTIPAVENAQEQKLEFTVQQIEQPYTIACNTFAPETLNIKFYTFVDYERYNVVQKDIPVLKDTETDKGTTYYYISNKVLQEELEKFHYDGSILNGKSERFYYSKRDYDTIHNAGKYTQNNLDCIYIGKTGQPMDVYYLPDGQNAPILNVKTLMEYHDNRYNGFYSVTVQDEKGQVYSPTALENLPAIDFVARKSTLTRTVSTEPLAEGETKDVNWECRKEDGSPSGITGVKDEANREMSFTISGDAAVRPYVIVPDNTAKPAEEKEANISFYVFIDGDYRLVKNINATQYYITEENSGRSSRYYLRAGEDDTISQIYKEFGFKPEKLEPGSDRKEKILFGYATDSRVFVQHPYKDKDGTWYIPVLKNGNDVSVYYFSNPNPLNPDRIENYFDRLTGLSAQIGVAGRKFDEEGSFHLVEVIDPMDLTEGKAVLRQYVPHGDDYKVEVPKKATKEGEYQGKDIVWSCTSNDRDAPDIYPQSSGADILAFHMSKIGSSYQIVADKPQEPGTVRIVYDTTRYMKKMPKEAKMTPQVQNKTRFIEDIPVGEVSNYKIKSPYPLTYDHEDNNSKELEQYEFDHWDYKNASGRWKECDAEINLSDIYKDTQRPIVFYASWSRVSDISRRQVQFYICKSAMPEDGSIPLPSVNEQDYTSAVAVANCNVKASRVKDVPVLGNKNPSTWNQYAEGHKSVMKLLQGTKADEGYKGDEDYVYKLDRIPSDEEVFQTIRESGRKIRIGQKEIPSSQLDTEFFTIYWYSFKGVAADGWHIDGRIVAKNGYLTVKKDFVGAPEVIEEIKQNYYMSIDEDATFSDGTPQPPAFHQHMKLVLPTEEGQQPAADNAPEQIVGTWDDETHTSCTWIVKADPFWKYTLKEYNYQPSQPNVQFSGWYNVHNSHEAGENVNTWELYPESGIKFTGRGLGRGGESLTIELENRYQEPGVLTLNKFDAITGQGMEEITFDVMVDGNKKDSVTTDKNGIAELPVLLQDDSGNNRVATETYLLRETNVPVGYIDPGDIEIKVDIKDGAFQIVSAKLVDRKAEGSQDGVAAPEDGKIDGKEVLTLRGATSLNIRNFSKSSSLHIKKTWENRNDALTEKQVKVRLYRDGVSTGQDFILDEENGWQCTIDKVPLFVDQKPVQYKIEEIEIGKTHYSPEFGDGFLYYEVVYPEIVYKDKSDQLVEPTNEQEFKTIEKIELEVQNLHFNLAERSILKTDDLPRKRLEGAKFMLYEVPYKDGTSEYVDDKAYTVEYRNGQTSDKVILKKDGVECTPIQDTEFKTDQKGMLHIPAHVANGRYWMVESSTPYKGDISKTQYEDNLALYMMDVEDEILFLYERDPKTQEWKPLTDRHIVNHPQKGGVTVRIKKEVTGPFGERNKPFKMKIAYQEDGMQMNKQIKASLKDGDMVTIEHVALGSVLKVTETVDTVKYDVSISRKNQNGDSLQKVNAEENDNEAVMEYSINGTPGDVIELEITNKNQEDATPNTGIDLDQKLYVEMLIIISIMSALFFWGRKKRVIRE